MTVISNNNIARAIYMTLKGKDLKEQSLIFPKIVDFLFKKRLLSKTSDILKKLNNIINTEEGKIEARIRTVKKINDITRKELARILSMRYANKEIIIEEIIDESLLGGWRVEVNDEIIDLSLKNKIKKLQEHLTKNI